MEDTYGDTVQMSEQTYDLTSTEFVNQEKQKELIEAKADLILFEPLTLKDNGQVAIDDSHAHISTIIQDVTDANEQTTFVIQPPHPLYNATYYPLQVEALKQYATDNNILYLDHWNSWSDQTSDETKALLTEDNELPNKDGYKLWRTYLEDFFITHP
ncbi:SGNH/GDSL hydrolase family protein [Peribacillus sp. Hz7]|uniref:SGNH/GDSL hydrolase family protein n=1 Tax=Peribacillus sp. Hz7 TaxID=3344873 RepID=UPI0035C949CA